jgi:hypothetical protein
MITALLDAGVPSGEISLVVREEAEEDVAVRNEMDDANAFADLTRHSAWERLGWQGGARPEYRDRISPLIETAFIAAGPIAIAIGGAQLGACSGGVVGSMTNFGYTHEQARLWRERLAEGHAWVMVRTVESQKDKVLQLLDRYHADLQAVSIRHW